MKFDCMTAEIKRLFHSSVRKSCEKKSLVDITDKLGSSFLFLLALNNLTKYRLLIGSITLTRSFKCFRSDQVIELLEIGYSLTASFLLEIKLQTI